MAKGEAVTAAEIAAAPNALQAEMMERCARYLISTDAGVGARDAVARFHLANGARLERLNWMGDTSATGLNRSYGLTVNYEYRLTAWNETMTPTPIITASHRRERSSSSRDRIVQLVDRAAPNISSAAITGRGRFVYCVTSSGIVPVRLFYFRFR